MPAAVIFFQALVQRWRAKQRDRGIRAQHAQAGWQKKDGFEPFCEEQQILERQAKTNKHVLKLHIRILILP